MFWKGKKADAKLVLSDNFVDEVMRIQDIKFEPSIEGVHFYSEHHSKIMLIAKVKVWKKGHEFDTVTSFASVNAMPYKGGQEHYAQIAVTRAMKTALLRLLGISDHDVELLVEAYGIDKSKVQMSTRESDFDTTNAPAANTEKLEPELDLGLDLQLV